MRGKLVLFAAIALAGCAAPRAAEPIRLVTLSDGTVIAATCHIHYPDAVADTMPPGTRCLDWETRRAAQPGDPT